MPWWITGGSPIAENIAGRQEFLLNGSPPNTELSQTPLPTTQLRWRPHAAASKTQSVAWDGQGQVERLEKAGKIMEHLGKIMENLGKIMENLGKIMEHLGKITENLGEI